MLQYLSRSSLHRLAGLPCRRFLSYGLQVVTRVVHRSSLRRLICPAQDHFIFLTLLIISMTFVFSLTQTLVFLSLYVMLNILLSILVCAAASLFCACVVSVQVSAPLRHSWQHTGVVGLHLSLQADGAVAFEDIPVFGVCRPACHNSSYYLFVLVLLLEAVALSQVCVAFNIFYRHIANVYSGVVYKHHLCLSMFILRPIRLLSSDSYCCICCNSCGVSVHKNMSPAKQRLVRNSPSIFTPLFSQFNLLNMLSGAAVNSFG